MPPVKAAWFLEDQVSGWREGSTPLPSTSVLNFYLLLKINCMKTIIESSFAIGDKAYTISKDLHIVEMTVGKISSTKTADQEYTYLYPIKEDGQIDWTGYQEDFCFHTLEQLNNHLNSNL